MEMIAIDDSTGLAWDADRARKFAHYREKSGFSQTSLAQAVANKQVKCSQQFIAQLEASNPPKTVKRDLIKNLLEAMGFSLGLLYKTSRQVIVIPTNN